MPAQCLVRKLTRAQVEKTIADAVMGDRLLLQDYQGQMLVAVNEADGPDAGAHAVLQQIANADADLTFKAQAALAAAEKTAAAAAAAAKKL